MNAIDPSTLPSHEPAPPQKDSPDSSDLLVEVAVEVPTVAGLTFTYKAPKSQGQVLESRGEPDAMGLGSTVLVPFGGREVLGFVVGFPSETQVTGVKRIISVVDALGLPADLVSTCEWMASYYASSIGEAVKLALPPGGVRRLRVEVELTVDAATGHSDDPVVLTLRGAGGVSELRELSKSMGLDRSELLKSLRAGRGVGLVRVRYLCEEARLKREKERVVRLLGTADGLSLPPAQAKAVKLLAEAGGRLPLRALLDAAGISRGPVTSLEGKGLLSVGDEEVTESGPFAPSSAPIPPDSPGRLVLTAAQQSALDSIVASLGRKEEFLLEGVTGSGKTEVYLRAIEECLARCKGAVLLVPEIALTPQTRARVAARFGSGVAVLHSALSARERWRQWHRIARGEVKVVVGTRSALFAPIRDLGLIIIDEEQETAYKQNRAPRYHARSAARKRAELASATLLMGTATPTVETLIGVKDGSIRRLELPDRIGKVGHAKVEVIDMRTRVGRELLCPELVAAMEQAFSRGEKAMVLLNRRGFASFFVCADCGHVPMCTQCSVSLTYHKPQGRLVCHHCGLTEAAPVVCPKCSSPRVARRGAGTQRAEEEIAAMFPGVPVVRMDADTTARVGGHEARLTEFVDKEGAALLVGTQMIAKGLHFPQVTLVGIIAADQSLFIPDFRSAERTFQLITQMAGRSGRGETPGRVIVQTLDPDHYAVVTSATGDVAAFLDIEAAFREMAGYPPYADLISLLASHPVERAAESATRELTVLISQFMPVDMQLLGPVQAPLPFIKGRHRWHALLKAPAGSDLSEFKVRLQKAAQAVYAKDEKLNVVVDVDPVWLL